MKVSNAQATFANNNPIDAKDSKNVLPLKIAINKLTDGIEVLVTRDETQELGRYLLSPQNAKGVLVLSNTGLLKFDYVADINGQEGISVSGEYVGDIEISAEVVLSLSKLSASNIKAVAQQLHVDDVFADNGNINLLGNECSLWGNIVGLKLLVWMDEIYQSSSSVISSKEITCISYKKLELANQLIADEMMLRCLGGDISYDLDKLSARKLTLHLNKASQISLPQNVMAKDGFKFIGPKKLGTINYELIAPDAGDIHITADCCLDNCSIKAKDSKLIIGSVQSAANLLANRLRLDVKSVEVMHGGLYASDVLLVKAQEMQVGKLDFTKKIDFTQHLPHLSAYIGAHKILFLHIQNTLGLEQAQVIVDGNMYLRVPTLHDIGSSVYVGKDAYIDAQKANLQVNYAQLPTGLNTRYNYIPTWQNWYKAHKTVEKALQVKTPYPLWLIAGVMHANPALELDLKGAIFYASKQVGLQHKSAQNVHHILQEERFIRGGHRKEHRAEEYTYHDVLHDITYLGLLFDVKTIGAREYAWLQREMLERQYVGRRVINKLLLQDVDSLTRLTIARDAYDITDKNIPIEDQEHIEASFLAEVIRGADADKMLQGDAAAKNKHKLGLEAIQHQLEHVYARRNNFWVPILPQDLDKELFAAIKAGDLALVKTMLAKGAHINSVDTSSPSLYSPLHLAIAQALPFAEGARWEIVRFLFRLPGLNFNYIAAGDCNKSAQDWLHDIIGAEYLQHQKWKQSFFELRYFKRNAPLPPNPVPHFELHQKVFEEMQAAIKANVAILRPAIVLPKPVFNNDKNINMAKGFFDRLQVRDMEMHASVYAGSMQEILNAGGGVLDDKYAEEESHIATVREGIGFERSLLEAALQACISGRNLEVIDTVLELGEDNPTWQMFYACKPLHLALKHKQVATATYLIDRGIGYLDLLTEEVVTDAKMQIDVASMDLRHGSLLDKLATHMQADISKRIVSDSKEGSITEMDAINLRCTMAILGQHLINEVNNTSADDLNKEIAKQLGDYFAEQENVCLEHERLIKETFNTVSQEYLKLAQNIITEHGDKIQDTKYKRAICQTARIFYSIIYGAVTSAT